MSISRYIRQAIIGRDEKNRSIAEQLLGLFIYLVIIFSFAVFINYITKKTILPKAIFSWDFPLQYHLSVGTIFYLFLSLNIWILWRKISINHLKLEISLLIASLLFNTIWSLFFILADEALLGLIFILLAWSLTLILLIVSYKRKKIAALFNVLWLSWISYLVGLNMSICSYFY